MGIRRLLNHRVVANSMWLTGLQAINMLVPLATLPYVTRVLGATNYGVFAWSLNLVSYLQVLVEYGFGLTGAREIALASDQNDLERTFSKIVASKGVLLAICLVASVVAMCVVRLPAETRVSAWILLSIVVGEAVRQTWVFHGLQQMWRVTLIVASARLVSAGLVLVLVKSVEHLYLYCALYASSYVFSGVLSAVVVRFGLKLRQRRVVWREVREELVAGWPVFTTTAMSLVFSAVGVTIVGLVSGPSAAGPYAAIQKIPMIIVVLYAPIGQALFPHIAGVYKQSFSRGRSLVVRYARAVLPAVVLVSLSLVIWRDSLVATILGDEFADGALLLVPFAGWLLMSVVNNLLGVQVLVASGHAKEYSAAFRRATLVIVGLCIILGMAEGAMGVATGVFLAELFLGWSLLSAVRGLGPEGG